MRMRALPSAVAVGAGRMRRCHWRRAELRTRTSQLHTRAGTPAPGTYAWPGARAFPQRRPWPCRCAPARSRKECRGPATAGRTPRQPCCARFSQICGTLAMAISIKSWMRATIEPSLLGVLITCYVMRNVLTSMTCKSSTCRCSLCTVAVTVLVSVCRCHSFSFSFRESTVIYNCHDTVLYD